MEFIQIELAKIEQVESEVHGNHISELNELQLALVGGGIGEVIVG